MPEGSTPTSRAPDHVCLPLQRKTVYIDADDLTVIKEAAAREGTSAAEIIRQAVHRAAMSRRQWDEPFFSQTNTSVSDQVADS